LKFNLAKFPFHQSKYHFSRVIYLQTFAGQAFSHKSVPPSPNTLSNEFYAITDALLPVFTYKLFQAAWLLSAGNHLSITSVKQK
jgi:hypothetical protein